MAYAQFGTNYYKYGSSDRLYGVPGTTPTTYLWTVLVDWQNNGTFSDGANESKYTIGLDTDRGVPDDYSNGPEGFDEFIAPPMVGQCSIRLTNHTGRFSPWSTSSDSLGFSIAPGRKVRVLVRNGYTSTDMPVFTGFLKKITEDNVDDEVTLTAVDGVEFLMEHDSYVALNTDTANATNDAEAFTYILQSINYPYIPDTRVGSVDIPYYHAQGNALQEIMKLAKITTEIFYIDASGYARVSSLNAGQTPSTDNPYPYDADMFLKDVSIAMPWENIKTLTRRYKNGVTVSATTDADIWDYGTAKLAVGGSSSVEIWADYQFDGQGVLAIVNTPVPGVDFIANTVVDGTGSNITSDTVITITDYGSKALVNITNNNAATAYYTTLKLRGTPLIRYTTFYEVVGTDYLGVGEKMLTTYSEQAWKTGTNLPYNDQDGLYQFIGYPQTTKRVTLGIDTRYQQFEREIGDKIELTISNPDLTMKTWSAQQNYNVFRLRRIRHRWLTDTGQSVLTEWLLKHALMSTTPTITL